ncbi:MAG: DUF2277 domain-containing protein [Actinomycetota bacterium]
MCRSIKQLRVAEQPITKEEITAASLQFVRKVTGFRSPSRANTAAFDNAVNDIAEATTKVLEELGCNTRSS